MINALETVIQYLKTKTATLGTSNIASKQRYGHGWTVGAEAIRVKLDDGDPQEIPVQKVRLEVSCFANGQENALSLWQKLYGVAEDAERVTVSLEGDDGLLYWLLLASGPSLTYDRDVKMDVCLSFWEALVSEEAV